MYEVHSVVEYEYNVRQILRAAILTHGMDKTAQLKFNSLGNRQPVQLDEARRDIGRSNLSHVVVVLAKTLVDQLANCCSSLFRMWWVPEPAYV